MGRHERVAVKPHGQRWRKGILSTRMLGQRESHHEPSYYIATFSHSPVASCSSLCPNTPDLDGLLTRPDRSHAHGMGDEQVCSLHNTTYHGL
jgi:hypothetical protein